MGNSASNPPRPPHSSISPNGGRNTTSPGTRQSSISPTPGNPHRSMRTKKRSLELPDLASLSLTPSATNTRGRQTKQPAMPIAIPTAAAGARNPFSHYSEAQGIPSQEGRRRRPKNYFESTGSIAGMVVSHAGTESREGSTGPDGRDSNIVEEEYEDVVPLEPSTHLPFPPPSMEQQKRDRELREQTNSSSSRARHHARQAPPPPTSAQQAARQAQVNRIQEMYDRSQDPHPSAPPSSPASISQTLGVAPPGSTPTASNTGSGSTRAREIVRSSIPIALGQRDLLSSSGTLPPAPGTAAATATAATVPLGTIQEDLLAADVDVDLEQEPAPVLITWRGGGTEVLLARAGDDEWKGRQVMEREHPNSIIFRATVYLRPGSHHIRFLVDGQWRVADDLPAAVDDQGSLANYVSVGDPTPVILQPSSMSAAAAAPPMTAATRRTVPGQSFWSAKSEGGDEDGYDGDSVDGHGRQGNQNHQGGQGTSGSSHSYIQARWTGVLPLELIEAAREEEAYLTASAGQYEAQNAHAAAAASSRVVVTGFVPAPNIPPAPGLPRHLDKLILNSRVGGGGGNSGSGQGSGSAIGERSGTPNSGHGHGVGSGQGGSGRRERERREKERRGERERDERERGDKERERERGDRERGERDRERERGERERTAKTRKSNIPPPPPPSEDGSNEMDIENTYLPMNETSAQAAAAAAAAAASGSGSGTSSGQHTAESSASSTGGTSTALTTPHVSVPPTPTGPLSPTQSPPKASYMEGNVPVATSPAPLPPSTSASASNTTPSSPAPAGSRAITIDTANMPSLTDDASVLAVPSHVVLHHLCTSAIKNGVLAVASTTRYKKKYLTTIYYKPT